MRVAICDDEPIIRDQIAEFVRKRDKTGEVLCFDTGETLFESFVKQAFDLMFLDIGLPGMDGVEVARRIRKGNADVMIVFITADDSRVFDAFDVSALHYLRKPIDLDKLSEVYDRAKRLLHDHQVSDAAQKEEILIKSGEKHIRLERKDILYVESKGRKLLIADRSGKYEIYGVLGKWEDRLGDRFYRCHRSYLVNLKYVRSYDAESILLRNGTRIFLARDRYSDFVKAYMQYLQTQGGRHV